MHRENSQSTNRQKLSLRNLLNIEYEAQYQSVTLNSRPKTMYNQRQLKIFQEDRGKLSSENKMRRGMSQQLSRPRYQSTQNPLEDKEQRQRLKLALGKINLLADGQTQVEQQQHIRSINTFLESLSRYCFLYVQVGIRQRRTQNFYKKAFSYIHNSFGQIVYINQIGWIRQNMEFVIAKTQNEVLIRLYNGVKDLSYKQLADQLFHELQRQLVRSGEHHASTERETAELSSKLKEKNQVIAKLGGQIHYYQNHPSKAQYGYICQLEQRVAGLQKQLRQSQLHIRELENSQEYLNQYTTMLNEKLQELRAKLYEFEIEQFSTLKEVEKNSELKQFEQNVVVLKDLIHKGALRMSSMREEYNKLESYNHQLIGQRSVLAKRAAVGFAELTPRPNYKQIFKDHDIDAQQLLPHNVKPTTQELVSSLLKCFKNVYQKYVSTVPRLDVEQLHPQAKGNRDPAKFILKELDKARKQLKKTEGLLEEVHKGYGKQKEEKSQVAKGKKK